MAQITLFTGENAFLFQQEKNRWISEFSLRHGQENLSRLEGKTLSFSVLLDELSAAPFIADRRLIVIDGIPKFEKEQVSEIVENIHPQAVTLFLEPKPDKRFAAVKELLRVAEVKTFPVLGYRELAQWVSSFAASLGAQIPPVSIDALIASVGEDQFLLSQEIRKLAIYAASRPVTKDDIDLLTVCSSEQAAWRLMDLLGSGDIPNALAFVHSLLQRGEDPYGLWNQLLWMINQILLVYSAVKDGQSSVPSVMKSTGASFGAARSLIPLAKGLSERNMQHIVRTFAEADIAVKTGVYRSTSESTVELCALIDSGIHAFHRS